MKVFKLSVNNIRGVITVSYFLFTLTSLFATFSSPKDIAKARKKYVNDLYDGKAIPNLWVPLLTHFNKDGVSIDTERTKKHLNYISKSVGGILIPGSTGEGWELDFPNQINLLKNVLPLIKEKNLKVSIGILRLDYEHVKKDLNAIVDSLKAWSGKENIKEALAFYKIVAFTICNPKGKNLSQKDLISFWTKVLDTKLPIVFYQLPQVTENELSPESLQILVNKYSNLYMVKDTSGKDVLANSGKVFSNVFFMRGFEGNYYKHLKNNGGKYDGFLLGTANVFAKEFAEIIKLSKERKLDEAKKLSDRLDDAIQPIFKKSATIGYSNAFAVTNKAFDYFKAYGKQAKNVDIKTLYKNKIIPVNIINVANKALNTFYEGNLEKGYMFQ